MIEVVSFVYILSAIGQFDVVSYAVREFIVGWRRVALILSRYH